MMVIEDSSVPEGLLPVEALKRHLRMGSGFAEDHVQDQVLASFLLAALAAVEGRTDKILIARPVTVEYSAWQDAAGQRLPVAPVRAVTALSLRTAEGAEQAYDVARLRLERDTHVPVLRAATGLPRIAPGGAARVTLDAGYAALFGDLPSDLQQAVLLLAAHYYEYRDDTALGEGCMPFGVTSLLARYRPLRVGMVR